MYDTILDRWDITAEELTEIVDANPSLRGFLMGYVSEYKVRQHVSQIRDVHGIKKYDDHDRTKKGDISLIYHGKEIQIEVKSLQTNLVKQAGRNEWTGTFQCDASDRRKIDLPNGKTVNTTCLAVGEFDIVAVNLFAFGNRWHYAFALNSDLPHPKSGKKYDEEIAQYLIASNIKISYPLQPPFTDDLEELLDQLTS